jgi:hypothetical protein
MCSPRITKILFTVHSVAGAAISSMEKSEKSEHANTGTLVGIVVGVMAASVVGAILVIFMCGSNEKSVPIAAINPNEMNRPAVAQTYPQKTVVPPVDPRAQQHRMLQEQQRLERERQQVIAQQRMLQEQKLAQQRKIQEQQRLEKERRQRELDEQRRQQELDLAYLAYQPPKPVPVVKAVPPKPVPVVKHVAQPVSMALPAAPVVYEDVDSAFDSSMLGWVGRNVVCKRACNSTRFDELDLQVGDKILVESVNRNGIASGKLLKTGRSGFFSVSDVRLIKPGEEELAAQKAAQKAIVPPRTKPSNASNLAAPQQNIGATVVQYRSF